MQFFFYFRGVSEWRVNEMSENGSSMASDLHLYVYTFTLFILAEKKDNTCD